jgi:hypothetical protein
MKSILTLICLCAVPSLFAADTAAERLARRHLQDLIAARDFPAVFQAWNPIDMPGVWPLWTNDNRLRAAAKHDVLWEEPVSQLGFNTALVLGAEWAGEHAGLATEFTTLSQKRALANRAMMLAKNPAMIFLLEVRWRDAPGSFLPEDSPFWRRNADGTRVPGWDNGPEPYYLLNPENEAFRANIGRQARLAIESGIYDGIMLDWSGHLEVVKAVRAAIGEEALIIVNIHDNVEHAKLFAPLINGSFMECNPDGPGLATRSNGTTWDKLRDGYVFMETHLREPRLNCLEVWGHRDDHRRLRAATTLALTHGNGAVLYADPNPLPAPDHMHDWYPLWDVSLGRPAGERQTRPDGIVERAFERGLVLYNHLGNGTRKVQFPRELKRASDGKVGREFWVSDADGDLFITP